MSDPTTAHQVAHIFQHTIKILERRLVIATSIIAEFGNILLHKRRTRRCSTSSLSRLAGMHADSDALMEACTTVASAKGSAEDL